MANKVNITQLSNPNILHNWDFTNPVNQRGQNVYSTNNTYTIDRFFLNGSTVSVSVESGFIRLTLTGTTLSFFMQTLENCSLLSGKQCTLSIKTSEGIFSRTFSFPTPDTEVASVLLGNSGFRANINFTLSLPRLRIYPDISLISAGASVDIYAVKLEIGSISTLAADPPQDYGVELTKCQRYYVPAYKEMDGFGTLAANGTDAYITFPVGIMRIMPTLGGGTATTSNWSIKLSDGSVRTPTDIFVQAITRTGVRLRFTIASAAGNITAIAFYNTNTDGGFDADL